MQHKGHRAKCSANTAKLLIFKQETASAGGSSRPLLRAFTLPGNIRSVLCVQLFMGRNVMWAAWALTITTSSGALGDYLSIQRKFSLIESGRLKVGSRLHLTPAELNAYIEHQVPALTGGVRNPRLRLVGAEVAQATALIDFAEIQRSQGNPPGWLMSQILEGERPVTVTARIRSGAGRATVDILSVEISGQKIDGRTLDFLVQQFLLPLYPEAAPGRPFELGDRIEKIDVTPTEVGVLIGR